MDDPRPPLPLAGALTARCGHRPHRHPHRTPKVGSVFTPPATPRNRTALRLSLHSDLTDQDVERIIHAAEAVRPFCLTPRTPTT
ncbi:hypothetical protein [Streptomyces sp. C]|uniref:hypothetical protein n=1 Tax=Streptomyces sp. C TaxID=253839 RepID=UPI0001B5091F|nr:hypothetical protein [Streptomyces sp. C]